MNEDPSPRLVIVNADDFGLSAGINRGIIQAHERGIVTSASLMVRWPHAKDAAEMARMHPALSIGLHLDMGELIFRDAGWVPLYSVLPAEPGSEHYLHEVERQLDIFHTLAGRAPTHLDSHQHGHRSEPFRSVALAACRRLQIPLREISSPARYVGDFYGQCGKGESFPELISAQALHRLLTGLPPGITELGCHPAAAIDFDSTYRDERLAELDALCDPALGDAIRTNRLRLISFHDIASSQAPSLPAE